MHPHLIIAAPLVICPNEKVRALEGTRMRVKVSKEAKVAVNPTS